MTGSGAWWCVLWALWRGDRESGGPETREVVKSEFIGRFAVQKWKKIKRINGGRGGEKGNQW